MERLVGQTLLNRYRVDAFLGRGGMAQVYKAFDMMRAVFVAIKSLNEDLAGDYVFLNRFAKEAQTLETLVHPNIVRFFGFEEAPGLAFLVMEFIEGTTLRRYLHLLQRPLTLPEALYVIRPVCAALHYAHEMGVYHCDIKPANIFIERGGRVVLADFGIARLSESATVTFSTPGTPAYMSPEQCRGEDLDAHTDLYSLGITTYEMLTLDRPFKGDTEGTTGGRGERVRWEQMHLLPPPVRSVSPEVPPIAEVAILRALEKEPERRQPGTLQFYEELSSAGAVRPVSSLPWVEQPEGPLDEPSRYPPPPPPPPPRHDTAKTSKLLPALGAGVVVTGIVSVMLIVAVVALVFKWLSPLPNATSTPVTSPAAITDTARPSATSPPRLTPSPVPSATFTPTPPPPTVAPQPMLRWTSVGQSAQGRDISVAIVGYEQGAAVLVVGSIQGDQPSTRDLINSLIDDFDRDLDRIPADVAFHFIPTINPDGNATGTRRNAHNVDLNRNWDTFDWTPDPEQPEGIVRRAGGSRPHSEPETQSLADYLLALKHQNPNLRVVVWHASRGLSRGGQVYPGYTSVGLDGDAVSLAGRYARVSGYAVKEDWAPYETTGELITWCAEEGIEAIDIVIPRSFSGSDRSLRNVTVEALLEIAWFP
jgi:serine/threonine protein kinase